MANPIVEKKIEKIIEKYLPNGNDKVTQAVEYSLFSGGKRVRPILLLETALAVGSRFSDNICRLAAALEYIHTYSMIHDDLPAMDNDEVRRGVRTCHRQFGEATAILAGDALLNLAIETVLGGAMSDKHYQKAVSSLFARSGLGGMLHGQCLDLFVETKSFEDARKVALHKTGDLFRAAFVCGALAGHADPDEVEIFDNIGKSLGIAYQVVDDLLDAKKCEKSFLDVMSERECRQYARHETDVVTQLCDTMPHYDLSFIKEFAQRNLSRER